MATYTENYNLTMPEEDDYYNVETFNENFEAIDTLMAESETNISVVNEKIGTPVESGRTLFSLLESKNATGLTAIKSIQHYTYDLKGIDTQSYPIETVDPTKCIVLFERLFDANDVPAAKAIYTLNADNITFTSLNYTKNYTIGLWIIEFC